MREIIAIHVGHYSNYVGSHWLNLQEACFSYNPAFIPEIDNDILFREGHSNGRVTYTPRLLSIDLKGSLGYLPDSGVLHDQTNPQDALPLFEGMKVEQQIIEDPYPKNEFLKDIENLNNPNSSNNEPGTGILKSSYNLDDAVHTWTDFLIPRLHPRSINLLKNYHIKSQTEKFTSFSQGVKIWSGEFEEEFIDKLRKYMEECDSNQGFHIISDMENGFSGLSYKCQQHIKDEYQKSPVFSAVPIFGELAESDLSERLNQIMNLSLGISSTFEYSDLIVPLSTCEKLWMASSSQRNYTNIDLNHSLMYHTSAMLAAGLDVVTMPYRLRNSDLQLKDLLSSLNVIGRSVCSLGISMPFPLQRNENLLPFIEKCNSYLLESLTPHVSLNDENIAVQSIVSRGIKDEILGGKAFHANDHSYDCKSVKECFEIFFKLKNVSIQSLVHTTNQNLRCPVTFPKILQEEFNLKDSGQKVLGQLAEYRILGGLHNTEEIKVTLEELFIKAKHINPRRIGCELEHDEITEMLENLNVIAMNYNKNWEL